MDAAPADEAPAATPPTEDDPAAEAPTPEAPDAADAPPPPDRPQDEAPAAAQPTPEQIQNTPTVFQALGMNQNRKVLLTFIGISVLLVGTAFGVFLAGRELIPVMFPSVSRYDSPIWACGACVVATQVIVFVFYCWAWKHDVEEERRQKLKLD